MIRIRVKDKRSRSPIPGLMVQISEVQGRREYWDDTNYKGVAEFPEVRDGTHIIKIQDSEYRPFYRKTYLKDHSTVSISLERAYVS